MLQIRKSPKAFFFQRVGLLTLLIAIWMDQIFLRFLGFSGPVLALIVVYYWVLYCPRSLSALTLFVLGLYQDLLMNIPLGVSSVLFIALYLFIYYQRHVLILSSFLTIWGGFIVSCVLKQGLFWLILCILNKTTIPFFVILYNLIFSSLIYPFFMRMLIYIHSAKEA